MHCEEIGCKTCKIVFMIFMMIFMMNFFFQVGLVDSPLLLQPINKDPMSNKI